MNEEMIVEAAEARNSKVMKAVVFSDLHLAYNGPLDYELALPVDTDLVIVAGDIDAPVSNSIKWAYENLASAGHEVILVAGNHEHYGHCYEESMASGLSCRKNNPGVHFLENEQVVIGGVRFLGATLWTDFNLYQDQFMGAMHSLRWMNDYRVITSIAPDGSRREFVPYMPAEMHEASVRWLSQALKEHFEGPTVVVTHHAPHPLSIAPKYEGSDHNPSYVSDLSALIEEHQPQFWIHGHTHTSFDYLVPGTRTRVVCNPRGYVGRKQYGAAENKTFEPFKVIEIPVSPTL